MSWMLRIQRRRSPPVDRDRRRFAFPEQVYQVSGDAIRVVKRRIAEHRGDTDDFDGVLLGQ